MAYQPAVETNRWNSYVSSHPWGQFQQSTCWAHAKGADGWDVRWMLVTQGGELAGGAQILVRSTPLGRVGFVNKGPLVTPSDPVASRVVVGGIRALLEQEQLAVLLVHPPDHGAMLTETLQTSGFVPDTLLPIITANCFVPLSGQADVRSRFRGDRRRDLRHGLTRDVSVVEGSENDVPEFFALMEATCRHQRTTPNPPTAAATTTLCRAFSDPPLSRARITFAVADGRRVAGALCLAFGNRVTLWKVGWDRSQPQLAVNTVLTWEAMQWAARHGFQRFDFGGVDRKLAETLASGRVAGGQLPRHRDVFKLGFGGEVLLLPPLFVTFARRWMKGVYSVASLASAVRPAWLTMPRGRHPLAP